MADRLDVDWKQTRTKEEALAVVDPVVRVMMDTNRGIAERLQLNVDAAFFRYSYSRVNYLVAVHRPMRCAACGKIIERLQPAIQVYVDAGWLSHEECVAIHAYREPCQTGAEARVFRLAVSS